MSTKNKFTGEFLKLDFFCCLQAFGWITTINRRLTKNVRKFIEASRILPEKLIFGSGNPIYSRRNIWDDIFSTREIFEFGFVLWKDVTIYIKKVVSQFL